MTTYLSDFFDTLERAAIGRPFSLEIHIKRRAANGRPYKRFYSLHLSLSASMSRLPQ